MTNNAKQYVEDGLEELYRIHVGSIPPDAFIVFKTDTRGNVIGMPLKIFRKRESLLAWSESHEAQKNSFTIGIWWWDDEE